MSFYKGKSFPRYIAGLILIFLTLLSSPFFSSCGADKEDGGKDTVCFEDLSDGEFVLVSLSGGENIAIQSGGSNYSAEDKIKSLTHGKSLDLLILLISDEGNVPSVLETYKDTDVKACVLSRRFLDFGADAKDGSKDIKEDANSAKIQSVRRFFEEKGIPLSLLGADTSFKKSGFALYSLSVCRPFCDGDSGGDFGEVIYFSVSGKRFLLSFTADGQYLDNIVRSQKGGVLSGYFGKDAVDIENVDVYKVSANLKQVGSDDFLSKVNPDFSIASVIGRAYTKESGIKKLQSVVKQRVFFTDEDGDIVFTADGDLLTAKALGKR